MNSSFIQETKTDKEELSKFQGVWNRVFGEVDSSVVPNFVLTYSLMVINGNRATIMEEGQTFEMEISWLDAATKPKQIDIKSLDGSGKGSTSFGIYELDDDSLRICHTSIGPAIRPEKFEIAEGSGLVQSLWKRVKK